MPLVVEDGTGLANADSYQTLEDARLLASDFGVCLPASDFDAEVALRNGARYADRYEGRFSGHRLVDTQALSYPREDSCRCYGVNTIAVDSGVIPMEILLSQLFAAVEYGAGTEVMPVDDGRSVQLEEVVGAVKAQYFDNGKTGGSVVITKSVDALKPLLCVGGGLSCRTVRV
jgi:hypothetical protein